MLEVHISGGVQEELREYQKDNSLTHLSSALELLGSSTPPFRVEERIPWINELVNQYRQVGRVIQSHVSSQRDGADISGLPGFDLENLKENLQTFEEQFKQGDYDDASHILSNIGRVPYLAGISNLLNPNTPSQIRNIFLTYVEPMEQIIGAYSRLAEKLQESVEKTEDAIEEEREQKEERERKFNLERQLEQIGNFQ